MIPTKFSTISNQELMDKLAQIVVKLKEHADVIIVEPAEATDILLEVRNRIEAFDYFKDLFEKPAYAQMSLDISPDYKLELNLKVKN